MPESFTDSPILGDRFEAALRLAVDHHRRQLRKGTQIPYPAHLLAVAALVLEMDGDEDEAIGALLHDMVEDGGGPPALAQIKREFGDRVAAIVRANSDTDELPKPPWRARKEAYIAGVAGKSRRRCACRWQTSCTTLGRSLLTTGSWRGAVGSFRRPGCSSGVLVFPRAAQCVLAGAQADRRGRVPLGALAPFCPPRPPPARH